MPFKKLKRGQISPKDDELVMQDRSNKLTDYTVVSQEAVSHGSPILQGSNPEISANLCQHNLHSNPSSILGRNMPSNPMQGANNQQEHSAISSVS